MGRRRLGERVAVVDRHPDRARRDDAEELLGCRQQVLALRRVGDERRPREKERALHRQDGRVDRRDRAGRVAEAHHQPQGGEAVERVVEGRLPHGVVDDGDARPTGQRPHALREVLARVDDHVIAAVGPGEGGLGVAADGADDGGTQMLGPLAGDEADTPGGRVEEDRVTTLHPVRATEQVLGGQALQHHRGSLLVADRGRLEPGVPRNHASRRDMGRSQG